jgi:adenosylhomocysteine nucleosidase
LIRRIAERRELAARHQAVACDMETCGVAEVCARDQTRFLPIRIISDAVDDRIPKEAEHLLKQKTLAGKLGALAGAILDRPGSIKDLWQLREDAIAASDRLARFLAAVAEKLPAAI